MGGVIQGTRLEEEVLAGLGGSKDSMHMASPGTVRARHSRWHLEGWVRAELLAVLSGAPPPSFGSTPVSQGGWWAPVRGHRPC